MGTKSFTIALFLSVISVEIAFSGEPAHISSNTASVTSTYSEKISSDKSASKRPFALKSNLLYWAAATPNISAEFYLSSRWSLNTEVDFAWWSDKSSSFYWQVFAVTPELRFRFPHDRPFNGHYVGIYAGGGIYDIMFKPLTHNKGYQGEFYTATGISYGYTFPISKHLSLELGLGVGYMTTRYREYIRGCSGFMRTDTKRTTWVGPTKINLMLIWLIPK